MRPAFAIALTVLFGCAAPHESDLGGFDVQGHRGARGLLPENTLPAFALAIELGVSTLEMDVGVSRDGVPLLHHDPFVNPDVCLAPDGSRLEGERGPLLRDLDAATLRTYDCGTLNPDPVAFPEPPRESRPGTPMPTLHEVLSWAAGRDARVRFNVEIKAAPGDAETLPLPRMVDAVLEAIRAAGVFERTTLQSFEWRALEIAKRREPRLRTVGLVSPHNLDPAWLAGLDPATHADFLALLRAAPWIDVVSPWWRMLVPGEHALDVGVGALREAGYPVVPWTVNDPEAMRTLIGLGVDGLISDYPDRLLAEARRAGRVVGP